MLRTFSPSLERASHNDWCFLENRYRFHLGREDVVGLYSGAVWLRLTTDTVVLESE